jgi:hypothetical protein
VNSDRWFVLARFIMAAVLGLVLYRLAPTVSYRMLAMAFGTAVTIELVVSDLTRPLSATSRLRRACTGCILVVACAPWRITGAMLCLAVFGIAVLVARARPRQIPMTLLWLSPFLLGVGTWLIS